MPVLGNIRKPTVVKAYVCIFACLSVKPELVSDLMTAAFLAALKHFIARQRFPVVIRSDHGTNFVGASNELKEISLTTEMFKQVSQTSVLNRRWNGASYMYQSILHILEDFGKLPSKALKLIVGNVKLTYEELARVLSQIK